MKEGGRVLDIDRRHLEGDCPRKAGGEKWSVSAWIFTGQKKKKNLVVGMAESGDTSLLGGRGGGRLGEVNCDAMCVATRVLVWRGHGGGRRERNGEERAWGRSQTRRRVESSRGVACWPHVVCPCLCVRIK